MQNDYRAQVKAHRKQWLDALRSGKYKQGKQYLHRREEDAYCCLGVACALAGTDAQPYTVRVSKSSTLGQIVRADMLVTKFGVENSNESVLPNDVMEWLGLLDNNPVLAFPEGHKYEGLSLAELNDAKGMTLAEIADAIEEYGFTTFNDALKNEETLNA